jgi:hypothetical protein
VEVNYYDWQREVAEAEERTRALIGVLHSGNPFVRLVMWLRRLR